MTMISSYPNRRKILLTAAASAAWISIAGVSADADENAAEKTSAEPARFQLHQWKKHPANPILPPGKTDFDSRCCMNPFVLRQGDEYLMFYAGCAGAHHRICLATARVDHITEWKRHGPLFDVGKGKAFDASWCVLPCVHRIGNKWHLYYTGRGAGGGGLQSFAGIGLATSDDLRTWVKHSDDPILRGDGFPQWPNNRGIAGGARIIELPQADGRILYRMYYTLATGTPSKDLKIDQAKQSVIAHSHDGLEWFDKRVVLQPRLEAEYENAATIALNVWKTRTRWRAVYAGIGSQFGAYSICEAVSQDGLSWNRGKPGENLSLPPTRDASWEGRMTTYPNVIEEDGKRRLFYCGNGYGATGIGTAVAEMLD